MRIPDVSKIFPYYINYILTSPLAYCLSNKKKRGTMSLSITFEASPNTLPKIEQSLPTRCTIYRQLTRLRGVIYKHSEGVLTASIPWE